MDFPADFAIKEQIPEEILKGLNIEAAACFKGKDDYMVILENQKQIEELEPNFQLIARLSDCRGVIATAPGEDCDFISRCFFPQSGVNEDPVTGSAHTLMTPYWAKRLGKNNLTAEQLSNRKGVLQTELKNDRVKLIGQAKTYLKGEIEI